MIIEINTCIYFEWGANFIGRDNERETPRVNNNLTWKEHLNGDNENEGLITQLKKRVGTLKRLAKYISKKRLSMLSRGIFYSKLVYCLAVIGNVSGMLNYREGTRMAGMTAGRRIGPFVLCTDSCFDQIKP